MAVFLHISAPFYVFLMEIYGSAVPFTFPMMKKTMETGTIFVVYDAYYMHVFNKMTAIVTLAMALF